MDGTQRLPIPSLGNRYRVRFVCAQACLLFSLEFLGAKGEPKEDASANYIQVAFAKWDRSLVDM